MTSEITDKTTQAEARTEETRSFIRQVKRITRRQFTAKEKNPIVLEGIRHEVPVRELCCREGIQSNVYYSWPSTSWRRVGNGSPTIPPRVSPRRFRVHPAGDEP